MEKLQTEILNKFRSFEKELNGFAKSEMHEERLQAIADIESNGMPGKKSEDWKYTFLSKNLEKYFNAPQSKSESIQDLTEECKSFSEESIHIYNINGDWILDKTIDIESNIKILNFKQAQEDFGKIFQENFNKISTREQRAFGKLNTAFIKEGLFIYCPKNECVSKDIQIHIISDTSGSLIFSQPRILVVAEENSELKIVENYHQKGLNSSFTNTCTEIAIAQNARLEYYKLQLQSEAYYHSGLTAVTQQKSSVFSAYAFSFGGAMLRNDLDIHLLDEHIESHMYGAYVLNGKTHVDNHSSVNHAMPNCESNELYKGIMNDNSTAVFNGKIFVRKDAQKTNAFQSNRNLLLSPDATVHTKPQLEIWADDVKCSHGATIGQLDEEQLFYLRSRGIPKKEAIALLTHAFIEEVIEKVKIESIRKRLDSELEQRMEYSL
ncbi:MAG: Fe-S cluster assembly protein SufD [Cytophagales bacterium]